ncbi:MAG: hypothetical protein HND47_03030 [Chloroflexi bacterium]|nr:hypothetical protein [Chloroflexota bacterium]
MNRFKEINKRWLILGVFAVGIVIVLLPPVRSRLSTQYELLRTRIVYFFNPPSEAVFEPSEQIPFTVETAVGTARAEMLLTLTPKATPTPKAGPNRQADGHPPRRRLLRLSSRALSTLTSTDAGTTAVPPI